MSANYTRHFLALEVYLTNTLHYSYTTREKSIIFDEVSFRKVIYSYILPLNNLIQPKSLAREIFGGKNTCSI